MDSDLTWLNAFPALTELYLDDNTIDNLTPDVFLDKFDLKKLSLRNNRISSINSSTLEWFEMSGESLFLSGNVLTDIASDAFLSLSYLKQLDLSNNSISKLVLPPVMPSLQVLRLDANQLNQFPDGLRNFGSSDVLTLLNVSSNRLTTLPSLTIYGTGDNAKVQTVDLHGNQLTTVDGLTLVGYFKTVNLQDNTLTDISAGVLNRIINLTQLDLSWNLLSTIPQTICSSSFAITSLKLSDNRIANICEDGVIANMSSAILDLDLSYNQLVEVPPSFLSFLGPSLNHLNLSNNFLSKLNGSSVEISFPNLQSLYMEGNSWNCDCNLLWYRQLAARIEVDWPVCAAPSIYQDILVECYDVGSCAYPFNITTNPKCSATIPAIVTHARRTLAPDNTKTTITRSTMQSGESPSPFSTISAPEMWQSSIHTVTKGAASSASIKFSSSSTLNPNVTSTSKTTPRTTLSVNISVSNSSNNGGSSYSNETIAVGSNVTVSKVPASTSSPVPSKTASMLLSTFSSRMNNTYSMTTSKSLERSSSAMNKTLTLSPISNPGLATDTSLHLSTGSSPSSVSKVAASTYSPGFVSASGNGTRSSLASSTMLSSSSSAGTMSRSLVSGDLSRTTPSVNTNASNSSNHGGSSFG